MSRALRVLVVEDQPNDAEVMARALRRAGFEPDWHRVDTEAAYLERLDSPLDIILSDYALPKFSGPRAFELLQRSGLELPFIIVSGTIGEEIAVGMLKLGVTDFLLKDRLERLGPAVTRALAESQSHRERQQAAQAAQLAETALRESEQRFQLVARAMSDAAWDWDLVTQHLWRSDCFMTTFGYAAGEIAPSVEAWTSRIHPEDRKRVVDSIQHAIEAGTKSWSADYRLGRKDGTHAFVHDRGYILRDPAGQAIRMVGGLRDLSDQKKMEGQYLRAQRMESIGTLAGGIAHDLNNVLAPIMMSIELLKLDAGNDARRTKILDTIHGSSQRGADLVRQVLSFARGLDGQRTAIRLRHLIDDLENVISQTFPRNIQIATSVPNDLWPVTGDPTQVQQVLLNLVVNARDAMPQGGTLTITAANIAVDEQFAGTSQEAKAGSYVQLQVTDTGQGIPSDVRERIFEPFFTTKEQGKGTGLGLATVHVIVRSHGGFLNVESEVGRGTTFKVYLPADPERRAGGTQHPFLAELPRGHDELVLVVDDEFSIRHITQKTLEAFGYRVLTASDGAEAVAIFALHAPEIAVVLTDMMMPVMDGAAAIQELTRIDPSVRIIAVSGLVTTRNPGKADQPGARNFLAKPYTAQTLLRRIRETIDLPPATAP